MVTVSAVVQDLQDELGVKLLERLGNKRQLTEAGKRLLQRAEDALKIIERIQEEIDELKGLKKGKLAVGGSGLAAASGLPIAMQKFKKEHPGVETVLIIDTSENLEKQLLAGEMDIAILSWPTRSTHLISELWREEDVVVVASPNHPLTKKRIVPLKLLTKEPLIGNLETIVRELIEKRFAEKGLSFQPTIEVKAHSKPRDAIKNAVISNLGIGFLARRHIIGDLKAKRLRVVKVPDLQLRRPLYVTTRKTHENRLVPAFITHLSNLKENPTD